MGPLQMLGSGKKTVAGVDEAGRGPVLGPLVVAAVLVDHERALRKLGVKDSKLLSPKRREELAPEIIKLARATEIRVVSAEELNAKMPTKNLNEIEVDAFAELLERLAPTHAKLDACDVDAARFGRNIGALLTRACIIRAEHGADARHPSVAAASILAKVERDRQMADICAEHGACGSGYSHDVATQEWLKGYVREHNRLPPIARREWETSKRLLQRDLSQFLGAPTKAPAKARPVRKPSA